MAFDNVRELGPFALALILLAITVGLGAVVLNEIEPSTYDSISVTNETFNATSDPFTYTVDDASKADFVELTSVTCYADQEQTTELTGNDCNISDAGAGDISISTTVDDGNESVDYDYDEETEGTTVIQDGVTAMSDFGGWFGTLVILGVVVIIFLFLGVIRQAGNKAQA